MRRAGIIALSLASALALSGCGFGGDDTGEGVRKFVCEALI